MKDTATEAELTLFPEEGRALDDSHLELLRTTLAIFDVDLQIRDDGSIIIIHDVPSILDQIGYLIYSFSNGRYKPSMAKQTHLKKRSGGNTVQKFKQVREMAQLLKETTGEVVALMTCIPQSISELSLSTSQILAFCRATLNGKELWTRYEMRRDSPDTPEDYCFKSFMVEVLAKTDHPVRSCPSAPASA